jgi:type II secretory pathway pseudopilin PulG
MKRSGSSTAFSLVEVTLALGVAAFSLLVLAAMLPISLKTNQASSNQTVANGIISQVADDLRAAARLPPGQASKQFLVHGPNWTWDPTPQYIYFNYNAKPNDTNHSATASADAIYRVTIVYRQPPVDTTSLADIKVTWPAAPNPTVQTDVNKVAGSVEMFVAINR